MTDIELLARAVIRQGDRILLAHMIGEINTFLPGGHIEPGEYAEEALRRELCEELGVEAEIGGFVGVLEHKFTDEHDRRHEEINIVFTATIKETEISSAEGHLEFLWVKPDDFNKETLLPSSFQWLIKNWLEDGRLFHYAEKC